MQNPIYVDVLEVYLWFMIIEYLSKIPWMTGGTYHLWKVQVSVADRAGRRQPNLDSALASMFQRWVQQNQQIGWQVTRKVHGKSMG